MSNRFMKAQPVWVRDAEREMNLRVQFKAVCPRMAQARIRIATAGIYQLTVNGQFVSYGPARAGRHHFRMEDIDIAPYLTEENNAVVVEVAGYYCANFYLLRQDSFLQAEIVSGNTVMCYTGGNFAARINPQYIQKIQRYSYQRPFAEAYTVDGADTFLTDGTVGDTPLTVVADKRIIERGVPYPTFPRTAARVTHTGRVERVTPSAYEFGRYITHAGLNVRGITGWPLDELDCVLERDWQQLRCVPAADMPTEVIAADGYNVYEFPYNATGVLQVTVTAETPATVYLAFDELPDGEQVNPRRATCCNLIRYDVPAGEHTLTSFEVYTMKYLQVVALGGRCTVSAPILYEYKHPPIAVPTFADDKLQTIAFAAVESYRQNAVDVFTDCPSRERAGWLCDSFFLGRAEQVLTGKNVMEEAFLENFLCEDTYEGLPRGMVPMCYPSEHIDGAYLPNWAMWLVLELRDYRERSGKTALVERFRDKVYALLDFFRPYENAEGLLENLDGWVFLEWSRASDEELVRGINFPTNMLYYAMLKAVADLYDDDAVAQKADALRRTINEYAFDGTFFVDHADTTPHGIAVRAESTEACQYYAFFCGVATPQSHTDTFRLLVEKFGPTRDNKTCYPQVAKAAPFIGNFLRLDILKRYGYEEQIVENIKDYYYYMAQQTGTLWEMADTTASCNHGFSGCLLYWLIP